MIRRRLVATANSCVRVAQRRTFQRLFSTDNAISFSASAPTSQAPQRTVTLFTRPTCSLCEPVKFIIHKVKRQVWFPRSLNLASLKMQVTCRVCQIPFRYEEVDISASGHERWLELYQYDIPVVTLNGREIARHKLAEQTLVTALTSSSQEKA
jgi:hypothetical protein